MPVRPEDSAKALIARSATRRGVLASQNADLKARLPAAAEVLIALGASRVVLFGSQAHACGHEASDVDLLVWGLPVRSEAVAWDQVSSILGRPVDLVRAEDASPSLLDRIAHDGVELVP